jgi:hypothetical protein
MKKNLFINLLFACSVVMHCTFVSCESWNDDVDGAKKAVEKTLLSGYVQKGPFVSGSTVTMLELDLLLNQTGRSYSTAVIDNAGNFEQKNIELISKYAQMKADGYYFNEITGKTSVGQISLSALVDISALNSVNINVLTHLERARVEYLVKEAKKSFEEAKRQAQKEVLAIFNIDMATSTTSESLDLTNNAILLAISCILQGPLTAGELTDLMANISLDIRADGTLDNQVLGSRLVDNALTLSLPDVRKNIADKYEDMNNAITLPDFERYLQQFLENTSFERTTFITYPAQGIFGDNILSEEVTSVIAGEPYSMTADIPKGFGPLKVVIKGGVWSYALTIGAVNWMANTWDLGNETYVYTTIEDGMRSDVCIYPSINILGDAGTRYFATFEFYEKNANEPFRTKQVEIIYQKDVESPLQPVMLYDECWTDKTKKLHNQNNNKVSINQGIWGTLVQTVGALPEKSVPISVDSIFEQKPIQRELVIYEYTTIDKTKYKGNIFYDIQTNQVATTTCDEDGFFELTLNPGTYSVFIKEKNGDLYANRFTAKAGIMPVTVLLSDVSEVRLNLFYPVE